MRAIPLAILKMVSLDMAVKFGGEQDSQLCGNGSMGQAEGEIRRDHLQETGPGKEGHPATCLAAAAALLFIAGGYGRQQAASDATGGVPLPTC